MAAEHRSGTNGQGSLAQYLSRRTEIIRLEWLRQNTKQKLMIHAERLTATGKAVHHVTLHYESSDASVAIVTLRNGKITAVSKGACTVFVIAENGIYEEVTVKVK